MCDLTTFFCDANCCCDADCSAAEVARFTACLPEVRGSTNIPRCTATSTSPEANDASAQDPLRDAQQAVDSIFCIERESPNALKAQYYSAPKPLSEKALQSTVAADAKVATWQRAATSASSSSVSAFRVGDRLPAFALREDVGSVSTGNATPTASGFLPVPVRGFGDQCSDFEYARYLVSRDPEQCIRAGALELLCRGPLNASLLQHLWVSPTTVAAEETPPSLLPMSVNFSSTTAASIAPELSTTTWDPSVGCRNAVVGVRYDFAINQSTGDLVGATALVILQSIAALNGDTSSTVVAQTHSVTWRNAGNASAPQPVSGRPGYQEGKSILAAMHGPNDALVALPRGYGVQAGMACGPTSPLRPLRFLYDVYASGCAEQLTVADFRALCSSAGDVSGTNATTLPSHLQRALFPGGVPTRIGMFGDSDLSVASDWVNITYQAAPTPELRDLPDGDVECRGLAVGLEVVVVVSRFGTIPNPQDAIVGVETTFLQRAVRWRTATADLNGRNQLWWLFRLAFIRPTTSQTTAQGGIKPPPLLPTLPVDIFYPFTLTAVSHPDAPADDG
eukprot:GGOE01017994.1.p1 GENE.GGOE01017994.1~~GGOE01017994.1.p1  ORF type:complete len:607 (+),score=155.28 GGOE01017994.1:131-1822(+)